MFQHGLNRRRRDLAEAANRSKAHGLRQFVEQREIGTILRLLDATLRPAREHIRHFLRAHAAGNTLAAGLSLIKPQASQRLIHKIGVTNMSIAKRIAGARLQPTFLMADVEVVATYEFYNIAA